MATTTVRVFLNHRNAPTETIRIAVPKEVADQFFVTGVDTDGPYDDLLVRVGRPDLVGSRDVLVGVELHPSDNN